MFVGRIARRGAGAVVLLDSAGRESVLDQAQLEELSRLETSLMPGDFDRTLSAEELREINERLERIEAALTR